MPKLFSDEPPGKPRLPGSSSELPFGARGASLRRSLSCEEDEVVGPFEDSTARAYFTIEVAESGPFITHTPPCIAFQVLALTIRSM